VLIKGIDNKATVFFRFADKLLEIWHKICWLNGGDEILLTARHLDSNFCEPIYKEIP